MKKIIFMLMLALSQSVLAVGGYQSPKAAHYLTGFYFKGGLGGTTAQFDMSQDLLMNAPGGSAGNINQSVNHQVRGTQIAGLLGAGYAYQIDALWVIGAEFTAGFTSANGSFSNDSNLGDLYAINSDVKSTLSNDFALVVKPGLAIQQRTQFYGLLGARWGNFETTTHSSASISGVTVGDSSTTSNYVLGFTVGLGVERLLTNHWGLGLEYAYTSYGNIPSTRMVYASDFTDNASATASSSTLLLDATYRF